MKRLALLLLLGSAACFHKAYRTVDDCGDLTADQRIGCSACTLQNKAEGWLGLYEYRPENREGERCVRVK